MNVSMDVGSAFPEVGWPAQSSASRQKGFEQEFRNSVEETEEEKKEKHAATLDFPGQLSKEEQHKVEQLKAEAMQIASQSEDGLTSGQEAQIKSIQQQIKDITGMPMSEDLVHKAKRTVEQNRVDQTDKLKPEEQAEEDVQQMDALGSGMMAADGHPGMQMLRQNSLVTQIKGMGFGKSAFAGKL